MSHDESKDSSAPSGAAAPAAHKSKGASSKGAAASAAPDAASGALAGAGGVRRNAKGGVYVDPGELHQAFEFFDVEGKGFITLSDLKKRLGVFYQNLSLREYKFLMNNKSELTESDLLALLQSNELAHYDPVAEAFKIYDPADTGFVDLEVFREILANLGFGDITEQDVQTLIDSADLDGDGRVGLQDFRRMLPSASEIGGGGGGGAAGAAAGGAATAKQGKK